MTQPSGDGVRVALDALRSDARTWTAAASDLERPRSIASSLQLTERQLTGAAADRGLDRSYDEARAGIENMLRQAAEYFDKIASDLNSAAQQYEDDDQRGMHEIRRAAE